DLPRALAAAERAVALPSAPVEAWFNRALALEKMHLRGEAAKAWRAYLQRDSSSRWADDARRYIDVGGASTSSRRRLTEQLASLKQDDLTALDRLSRESSQDI